VTPTASLEFGIDRFDARQFGTDSVLLHGGLHRSGSCNRGHRSATNFLAARNAVFTDSLCYAKITPAALHCGDLGLTTTRGGEAAAGKTEFELDLQPDVIARLTRRSSKCPCWRQVKQTVTEP
jgi:hypothetical protein